MLTRFIFLSGIALVLASCSVLIDVEGKQCTSNDDCVARGAAFAGSVGERNLCVEPTKPTAVTQGRLWHATRPADVPRHRASSEPKVKYPSLPYSRPDSAPAEPQAVHDQSVRPVRLRLRKPGIGSLRGQQRRAPRFFGQAGFAGYFRDQKPPTPSMACCSWVVP